MHAPQPETREEQITRCLREMARDPEGLVAHVLTHCPTADPARVTQEVARYTTPIDD